MTIAAKPPIIDSISNVKSGRIVEGVVDVSVDVSEVVILL
jgi:hypothetical protein